MALVSKVTYEEHGKGLREWKLGLGPCGEVVTGLYASVGVSTLVIEQLTNRSHKTFHIPLTSIRGPIKFEHGEPKDYACPT